VIAATLFDEADDEIDGHLAKQAHFLLIMPAAVICTTASSRTSTCACHRQVYLRIYTQVVLFGECPQRRASKHRIMLRHLLHRLGRAGDDQNA
jgi:hypothetical protein